MICVQRELGNNIARMRKRTGITQQQLADALAERTGKPISLYMVSAWERATREVPASVIPLICSIIHCTSWDLYPHSESLSDRDLQLISTIKAMGEDEKAELYYLLHEWDGDRKALLKLDVLHAVQSRELRCEADKMIIASYEEEMDLGGANIDKRIDVDLDYVRAAFHHLYDD